MQHKPSGRPRSWKVNHVGSKSESGLPVSPAWSLCRALRILVCLLFHLRFYRYSFFRFSSKALFEWFSDTFQPQHSLLDDSFWGLVSAFSGQSFPHPCLGYFSWCVQSFGGICLCHRLASQPAAPLTHLSPPPPVTPHGHHSLPFQLGLQP